MNSDRDSAGEGVLFFSRGGRKKQNSSMGKIQAYLQFLV